MARSPDRTSKTGTDRRQKLWRELALVAISPLLLYLLASLLSYHTDDPGLSRSGSVAGPLHNIGGYVGAYLADMAFSLFGYISYTLPVVLGGVAWIALFGLDSDGDGRVDFGPALRLVGIVGFLVTGCGLAHVLGGAAPDLPAGSGGILGGLVGDSMRSVFGVMGGNLFLLAVLLMSVTLATGLSWFALMDWIGGQVLALARRLGTGTRQAAEWQRARAMREEREVVRKVETVKRAKREPVYIEPPPKPVIEKSERAQREQQIPLFNAAGGDGLPPLSLLDDPKEQPKGYSEETLETLSRQIEFKLKDFRVEVQVVGAYPGPVITRFEMEPAPGVKGSQISSLDKDIARGLSVKSVRVVDVIPGKSVVGLEIPNAHRETIYLSEILRSKEYDKVTSPLAMALGKDIAGRPVVVDLARMPHLLVAGTTGSGKSVAINTMILSILYRLKPEECRLIMVDPKMLELSVYDGIPHLLTPVVTDPKKAVVALKWAVREMEERYKKMSKLSVRNIDGFNARVGEAKAAGEVITRTVQTGFDKHSGEAIYEEEVMDLEPLPYIVVIVDEMADLMMVAGKEIEGTIQRLAQMARAAGIHVVLATQRPSVDVITGTIKANFPTRISFQVTSKIDSRTILGEMGAEQLLGQGDMLYMAGGGRITRVHGPFVSDNEVEKVVAHLKTQGRPQYLDAVTSEEDEGAEDEDGAVFDKSGMGQADSDDPYEQAVAVVLRDKKASTSYIQRRLQIGYNRAASIMERMENEGIVGPANHAGKREILVESQNQHDD